MMDLYNFWIFFLTILLINHSRADPHTIKFFCDGKPNNIPNNEWFSNNITIGPSRDPTERNIFEPKWFDFMNQDQLDQIKYLLISGCQLQILDHLNFKYFLNLDVLTLENLGLDHFDFELIAENHGLRELLLPNNENLSKVYGRAGVEVLLLDLTNTSLEDFPEAIMQFNSSLKVLKISGNPGGFDYKDVCTKFKKLTTLNDQKCDLKRSQVVAEVIVDVPKGESKSDQVIATFLLILTTVFIDLLI